jgi:hypothetical protein
VVAVAVAIAGDGRAGQGEDQREREAFDEGEAVRGRRRRLGRVGPFGGTCDENGLGIHREVRSAVRAAL